MLSVTKQFLMQCRLSWSSCTSFLVMPFTVLEYMLRGLSIFLTKQASSLPSLYCYVCVPLVVSCSQFHHYHQLWPTKKIVSIFILTWHHKRFGNDVQQLTLAPGCSVCAPCFVSVSACSLPGTSHWRATLQLLLSSCRAFARYGNLLLVRACRTESASLRNTAMVLFCCDAITKEMAISNASDSALQLLQCLLCCCTGCFCADAREVNGNTSPTVLNGISCGAISVDIDPSFWWVLFADHGQSLNLLGIVIICSLLKLRYLRANCHC